MSISLPIKDQVQNILAIRPHFIYSMTASLDIIATWMLENNVNYNEVSLIITSGATLTPEISDKFRKVFGQPGIDMYSFVEGGFIGGDCHHCGLKYFDDDGCIVEVLDGNDQSVRTGEKGRVVITVLDQFSTPIIRYDIGDYITLPPRQIRCKNNFTHYLSTDGRQADTLILRGGRIIQYQHTSVLHKIQGLRQFQFLQKANDDIVIKYVRKPGFSQAEIQRIILEKTRLENHPGLYFQECDSIPLEPSGKFKRVKKQAANESDVGLPCS